MKQNLNSLVIISARIVKMEKVAFKNYLQTIKINDYETRKFEIRKVQKT